MNISIRTAQASDAESLANIYNHYVANTCITFETDAVTGAEMAQRVAETTGVELPWLVAEIAGEIVGYAYASKWRARYAYRYSVESTVYLDPNHTGKGIGSTLYVALLEKIRTLSVHAVIGGIGLPNKTIISLH